MNTETQNPTPELTSLKGVGPASAVKFHKLGIYNLQDLFFHLPYRYEDRTQVRSISSLRPMDTAVIDGTVTSSFVKMGKRRSLLVTITDGSGFLTLRFFYFSQYQVTQFTNESYIQCYGEIRRGPETLEIVHPEYTLSQNTDKQLLKDHLTPVYHVTEGLQQASIRKVMEQALLQLEDNPITLFDLIPTSSIQQLKLPALSDAVLKLHQPETYTDTNELLNFKHPTQQRLIFEELLAHHLSLKSLRNETLSFGAAAFDKDSHLTHQFIQTLPFELTGAQKKVISEITNDQSTPAPMLRLVQGDVGSGKTVVAMAAALQAINSDWQVAMMAPTETLAEQHFQNLSAWAEPLGLTVGWLTGKVKAKHRRATLEDLASGKIQLLIGTHALFQDEVIYAKLGLIIIDEQHRFGVHQRLALKEKGHKSHIPHQLIMTATPIPRTLAMTAYADLDISIIDELPKGRQSIDTVIIPDTRRNQVIERVEQACQTGRQIYWVCPLIEESESLNAQAAENTAENLKIALPNVRIGLVHGRMKTDEKSQIIADFKAKQIDLLVATTVIEVGVDVPNASLMIIENAERLGLSQLHQLRGRVGRGSIKSSCVLMYSGRLSKLGKERLGTMRATNDGFVIAEKDLELRGPGELLGTKQTGLLQLRLADITRDQYLFPAVEKTAKQMFKECPENIPLLIQRWLKQGLQYGNV